MRAGDLAGDLSQGAIASSLELESVIENNDRMGAAMPFADKPCAGPEERARRLRRRRRAHNGGIGNYRRTGEALPRPLRQASKFEFLQSIGDGPDQEIAA